MVIRRYSKLKVAVISGENGYQLEKELANWLNNGPDIKIEHVVKAAVVPMEHHISIYVTIFYRDRLKG
jgi:hypothetical protein